MKNTFPFGRFTDPLKDYSKAVQAIASLEDIRAIESKYHAVLDDAASCLERINDEASLAEFVREHQLCYVEDRLPSEEWLDKYSAVPLPKLFIDLAGFYELGMPSGFFMHRLLDEGLAEMRDGRFILKKREER